MVNEVVPVEKMRTPFKPVIVRYKQYESLTSAADALGVTVTSISYYCNSMLHEDCWYLGSTIKPVPMSQVN